MPTAITTATTATTATTTTTTQHAQNLSDMFATCATCPKHARHAIQTTTHHSSTRPSIRPSARSSVALFVPLFVPVYLSPRPPRNFLCCGGRSRYTLPAGKDTNVGGVVAVGSRGLCSGGSGGVQKDIGGSLGKSVVCLFFLLLAQDTGMRRKGKGGEEG